MLIVAGILFGLALMSWFIDKWMNRGDIDLAWLTRTMLLGAAALTGLSWALR